MEKFRRKLKNEMILGVIYCCVEAIIISLLWFVIPDMPNAMNKHFTSGFIVGITAVVISFIVRNGLALRNESEFRKLYVKETDERTKSIEAQAGKAGIKMVLAGLSIAMVIAANVDKLICLTLLAATMFTVVVMMVTNFFYNQKL